MLFKECNTAGRSSNLAKRLDKLSRVLFPFLYALFVFSYFCKYLQ